MKYLFVLLLTFNVFAQTQLEGDFKKSHSISYSTQRLSPIPSSVLWHKTLNNGEGTLTVENDNGDFCRISFNYRVTPRSGSQTDFNVEYQLGIREPGSHQACSFMLEFQSNARFSRLVRLVGPTDHYDLPNQSIKLDGAIWVRD